jgi:hypothetical protein
MTTGPVIQDESEFSANRQPGSRAKTTCLLWGIIVGGIFGVCALSVLCVSTIWGGSSSLLENTTATRIVIDEFMQAMEARDPERAHQLFTRQVQIDVPLSEIANLLSENNYLIFENYERVEILGINVQSGFNSNPNIPGTTAQVEGSVYYTDGFVGSFTSTLGLEDGNWRLVRIDVNVPPDKFGQ